MLLHRSIRPRMKSLTRMKLNPLSRQLRVGVKVGVDPEEWHVTVDRERCRMMNLHIRISMKLLLHQRFSRVQHIYLRSYRKCNL